MTSQTFQQKLLLNLLYEKLRPRKYVVGKWRMLSRRYAYRLCSISLLISGLKQALLFNVRNSFISQTGNK